MVNKAKDPFEPFKDWLKKGSVGGLSDLWRGPEPLKSAQKKSVTANVELILNKAAWKKQVDAFENALAQEETEEAREKKRALYEIHFDQRRFEKANFTDYIFPCDVDFSNCVFLKEAIFNFCCFKGTPDFQGVNFSNSGSFQHAQFNSSADFRSVTSTGMLFMGVNIAGTLLLDGMKIDGSMYISGKYVVVNQIFASDIAIQQNLTISARFVCHAIFSGLEVKGTTSLSGSEFAQIPDFTDAKFDRPPEVAGMVVPLPETQKEKWWHFRRTTDPDDVAKLRKLKAMALQANDHEKDGEFFAKEMLAKRGVETTSFSGLLFNTFYWKLSDFGQSFVRPVLWMGASIYSFFCFYLGVINWQLGTYALPPSSDERFVAFSLSVFNFLPLLGGLFRFAKTPDGHVSGFSAAYGRLAEQGLDVDLMVWLNVLQNIIGAVLLFLFLLALRNKFRLK